MGHGAYQATTLGGCSPRQGHLCKRGQVARVVYRSDVTRRLRRRARAGVRFLVWPRGARYIPGKPENGKWTRVGAGTCYRQGSSVTLVVLGLPARQTLKKMWK